jgi:hypothetical protein
VLGPEARRLLRQSANLIRWRRDHEKTWHDEPCTEDVESLEAWLADDYTYLPF